MLFVVATAVPSDGGHVVTESQSDGGWTTEVRESPATEPSHCLGRLLGPEAAGLSSRKLPTYGPAVATPSH